MKQYKVLNHIAHNGKRYAADDTVEMSEANGQPLVKLGYLEPLIGGSSENDAALPPALAIAELFATAELPRDKVPTVAEAMTAIKSQAEIITNPETGEEWELKQWKIKADLRDEAWELYLKMPTGDSDANNDEDGGE